MDPCHVANLRLKLRVKRTGAALDWSRHNVFNAMGRIANMFAPALTLAVGARVARTAAGSRGR